MNHGATWVCCAQGSLPLVDQRDPGQFVANEDFDYPPNWIICWTDVHPYLNRDALTEAVGLLPLTQSSAQAAHLLGVG